MAEETSTHITIFKTPSGIALSAAFLIMLSAKVFGFVPDLSWWIVTAPLWAPWALCVVFFVGFYALLVFVAIAYVVTGILLTAIVAFFKAICYPFRKRRKDNEQ